MRGHRKVLLIGQGVHFT